MRTTCPKCKKGSLIAISQYEETITSIERVYWTSWGGFDADGVLEPQETEETEREQLDAPESETGDESTYVQCHKCKFVVADHPLTTLSDDGLDAVIEQSKRRPRQVRHSGATVATFDQAQQRERAARVRR